jgi:lipopolysaccharide transport system ATP-binding protein
MAFLMFSKKYSIKVLDLSKYYCIYSNPRDRLLEFFQPYLSKINKNLLRPKVENFCALKGISLDIKYAESLGIIGRNGSGKSTLLQLICGTLKPTTGKVSLNGKVAALLELGSGFHPEFTGRENIYINASILGLSQKQISDRYSKILEFADIGDFIDKPVRTYSSGMAMRLAFAVLAHVDADILVVDEALAVGDAIFAQKCMRFIREFQKTKTLILVSHDITSIQSLCNKTLWLKNGEVALFGDTKVVTQAYQDFIFEELYPKVDVSNPISDTKADEVEMEEKLLPLERINPEKRNGWESGHARIISTALNVEDKSFNGIYKGGEILTITIKTLILKKINNPIVGFVLKDQRGQVIFGQNTAQLSKIEVPKIEPNSYLTASFEFTLPLLAKGDYSISTAFANGDLQSVEQCHWLHEAHHLEIDPPVERYGMIEVNIKDAKIHTSYEHPEN